MLERDHARNDASFALRHPRGVRPKKRSYPRKLPGALITRSKPSLRRVQVVSEVGLLHHSAPSSVPTARSTARLAVPLGQARAQAPAARPWS